MAKKAQKVERSTTVWVKWYLVDGPMQGNWLTKPERLSETVVVRVGGQVGRYERGRALTKEEGGGFAANWRCV